MDPASRKRQSEALIFSKGSTVPTQHMRVGPGLEINLSPLISLLPQHFGHQLVCSLHSVIHRPAQGPLPFAGQAFPMLPFLTPASQLSSQEHITLTCCQKHSNHLSGPVLECPDRWQLPPMILGNCQKGTNCSHWFLSSIVQLVGLPGPFPQLLCRSG